MTHFKSVAYFFYITLAIWALNGCTKEDPSLTLTKHIISEQLMVSPGQIDVNTPLTSQFTSMDELDLVEIIMALEERTGVEISDEKFAYTTGEIDFRKALDTVTVKMLSNMIQKP